MSAEGRQGSAPCASVQSRYGARRESRSGQRDRLHVHAVPRPLVGERVRQGVVLGDLDKRGRDAAEPRAQRRGSGIEGVGSAHVLLRVPAHAGSSEVQPVRTLAAGIALEVGVGDRVDECLQRDRHALIAGTQRCHGGEVPARAVASDPDAVGVDSELGRVVHRPAKAGPCVLHRRLEAVLRREAVVDRAARAARRERAAEQIMRLETADHPAVSVPGRIDFSRDGTAV